MIVNIEAKFECDDCGTEFIVRIDPAYVPPKEWAIFDVAVDAIRGGLHYEDGTDEKYGIGDVDSDGRHYCDRCRRKRDKEPTT